MIHDDGNWHSAFLKTRLLKAHPAAFFTLQHEREILGRLQLHHSLTIASAWTMRGLLALALMGSTTMCSTSGAEATFPRQQTSELPRTITGPSFEAHSSRRLAVVVPAHAGDLSRVVESLERWPRTCSPITKQHADLVLYYAEGTDEKLDAVVPILTETAGSCFANTKIVYAHLAEEVRGPMPWDIPQDMHDNEETTGCIVLRVYDIVCPITQVHKIQPESRVRCPVR